MWDGAGSHSAVPAGSPERTWAWTDFLQKGYNNILHLILTAAITIRGTTSHFFINPTTPPAPAPGLPHPPD